MTESDAVAKTRRAATRLWRGFHGTAFKKLDSVWRGHPAAEIAAACAGGEFARVVVAPAFPEQGRVTRDGGQWVADASGERCLVRDIAAELRRAGLDATTEAAAADATRAIVCDACTPEDLRGIVARYGRSPERVLWCGTGGLARALAAHIGAPGLAAPTPAALLPPGISAASHQPAVIVVGTDHPIAQAQAGALEAESRVTSWRLDVGAARHELRAGCPQETPVVLIRFAVPPGTARPDAQSLIARALVSVVATLPRPRLVVATGGETLRALSNALGATRLEVFAERVPGIPLGTWADGLWAATPLLSKSGGFGQSDTLVRLLSGEPASAAPKQAKECE